MPALSLGGFTLYGDPVSGNCLKPKWTADLLGIPYTWVNVDVVKGETRTPDFLAINPAGQVPVARWEDGRVLPQSNAIMLYLAEGSRLIPADSFARAEAFGWLFWEQYSHETAIAVRRFQKHYLKKSDTEIDPALLVRGNNALGVMDQRLTGRSWFAGDSLSIADIALVAYTRVAHEGGFDIRLYPSVADWVHRTEDALGIPHAQELA
ncbi:glutathione S-transferase family protein [Hyphomonas sp. WL0036]|uniref:glutathione S-transferase family protein n=1 Tax=Hyphomonas sediminis TaxID=2866160 RepID=UPI001C7E6817|nr:glutathione S-transferase family protein [Hyphomonas sediminis]MBY9065696.1 glutathione S-transferase family protein [Hyphomonas sediminis]